MIPKQTLISVNEILTTGCLLKEASEQVKMILAVNQ
jgi:hypothetical protein